MKAVSLNLKCRIEWDQSEQEYLFVIEAEGKSVATLIVVNVAGDLMFRRSLQLRKGHNEFRLPGFNNLESGTYGYRLMYTAKRTISGMLTKR